MSGIPIHLIVEGHEVNVGDFVLVDDQTGWRKVKDVIRSHDNTVLKYDGGADMLGLDDFVSILRAEAVASREVC